MRQFLRPFNVSFVLLFLLMLGIAAAPPQVQAERLTYVSTSTTVTSTPMRVKQIEFSCEGVTECTSWVRYGDHATAAVGFPLHVTAGAFRVYDFWRMNVEGRYARQRGLLVPAVYYQPVTGHAHTIFILDKP